MEIRPVVKQSIMKLIITIMVFTLTGGRGHNERYLIDKCDKRHKMMKL
jgi:hypothetical protein